MKVPEHVRTTTAAYLASASCAAGGVGVYLLLSHRSRKLQRDHENELYDLERHYKRQLERAKRQQEFSHKVSKPGTWASALRDTLGSGMAGDGREIEGVGPDGMPLAIEGNKVATRSFPEASSVVLPDETVPDEAEPADHEGEPTDRDSALGSDGPVENQAPVRLDGTPHVISTSEFYEDHDDYQKISVKYYSGDRVLVDEKDEPIREIAGTIGRNIKRRFGQKSDDPQIVHIRNDKLEIDFEVCHDERSYAEVVLGYGNPALTGAKNNKEEE